MKDAAWWDDRPHLRCMTRREICNALKDCNRGFAFLEDDEQEVMRESRIEYFHDGKWRESNSNIRDDDGFVHRVSPTFHPPTAPPEKRMGWREYEVVDRGGMYWFDNDGRTLPFSRREDIPGYGGTIYEANTGAWFMDTILRNHNNIAASRPLKVRYWEELD
jgi:hypothetical protein